MERRHDIEGGFQQDSRQQPSAAARHEQDDRGREGGLHERVCQVSPAAFNDLNDVAHFRLF